MTGLRLALGFGKPGTLHRYVSNRVLQALPTLVLIVLAAFVLLQCAPGDMAQALAGESGGASPEYMAGLRESYGLDRPVFVQFVLYVKGVLAGDLGFSFRNNMPVSELITARLIPTSLLALASLVVAVLSGVAAGAYAAISNGGWADKWISAVALLTYALPGFLLGIVLILTFSLALPWFPIGGFSDPHIHGSWISHALDIAHHLVLPALTLGAFQGAIYARFTRTAMLEVLGQDYIRTARAKGLRPWRIVWRHSLRNALMPIITLIGMQAGAVLSGAILVETVFAWPGIGRLAFEAVQQRDYNLLAGLILCSGTLVVAINLAVDLCYTALDPRVRVQ
jgi:peptide/nickel transport system permease protein